jgi:hypothetical protein
MNSSINQSTNQSSHKLYRYITTNIIISIIRLVHKQFLINTKLAFRRMSYWNTYNREQSSSKRIWCCVCEKYSFKQITSLCKSSKGVVWCMGSRKKVPKKLKLGSKYTEEVLYRVARWHIFKPKIPIWIYLGRSCNVSCWYIIRPFGLFKG